MNKVFLLLLSLIIVVPVMAFENDFLADNYLPENIEMPEINLNYNYSSVKRVPIRLSIQETIKTKEKNIYEGQELKFVVKNNVYSNRSLILKKGDVVNARIETIVSSGMNGIPYYIYLGNFQFPNIENSKIMIDYYKSGQNRTYFVLPLKWALTFLPPTGSLTNFIMGGHAKITPKDVITAYYYPEWK